MFSKFKKAIQSGLYNCGLFNNIHFKDTYTSRLAGESQEALQQRVFLRSAQWLIDHLHGIVTVKVITRDTLPGLPGENQILVLSFFTIPLYFLQLASISLYRYGCM